MSWYYSQNDARKGPFDDAAFESLVGAGTIKPETLVWREGYAAWIPYSQASPAASGKVACSQCGRPFAVDEMVAYEGRHICAGCKPIFFQRIKEGASVAGQHVYAGFWVRFDTLVGTPEHCGSVHRCQAWRPVVG